MTPVLKWLKKRAEKWFGKWYEGPEPPARLGDMVTMFANEHRFATRAEWAAFARAHASEAYRAGYTRGFEAYHRDEEWDEQAWGPPGMPTPDQVADVLDPDWRWSDPVNLTDPDVVVSAEPPPEHKQIEGELHELRRRG